MKSPMLPLLLTGLLMVNSVDATEAQHIHASHAWLRVLPGDLPAGAYVTLENDSDQPAVLSSASSPMYADVMLHKSSSDGGMSHMTMIDSLSVPAHGKAVLAPAGYHLMLMKASRTVQPGDTVTLSLKFADGSTLTTPFLARPANAVDAGS